MDSDFVVGMNKSIDAAKGETGHTYPAYLHNTLVTEKLDELAEAITEGGGASALADLTDVDMPATVQGGKCLKYNAVTGKWEPGDDAGNVQSDWNESDPTSGAYILNKPTIPDAQVQANWDESDSSSKAYIQNKPTIPAAITELNDIPDVDILEPTDGQVIKYDSALDKWVNAAGGGGSSITIIPGTLNAGQTSITFTDARILADSIVSCATPAGINPTAMTSSVGSVTFYFASQAADMVVKAVIF